MIWNHDSITYGIPCQQRPTERSGVSVSQCEKASDRSLRVGLPVHDELSHGISEARVHVPEFWPLC